MVVGVAVVLPEAALQAADSVVLLAVPHLVSVDVRVTALRGGADVQVKRHLKVDAVSVAAALAALQVAVVVLVAAVSNSTR